MDKQRRDQIDRIMEMTKLYDIVEDETGEPLTRKSLRGKTSQELRDIHNEIAKGVNKDIIKTTIENMKNKIQKIWRDKK